MRFNFGSLCVFAGLFTGLMMGRWTAPIGIVHAQEGSKDEGLLSIGTVPMSLGIKKEAALKALRIHQYQVKKFWNEDEKEFWLIEDKNSAL